VKLSWLEAAHSRHFGWFWGILSVTSCNYEVRR